MLLLTHAYNCLHQRESFLKVENLYKRNVVWLHLTVRKSRNQRRITKILSPLLLFFSFFFFIFFFILIFLIFSRSFWTCFSFPNILLAVAARKRFQAIKTNTSRMVTKKNLKNYSFLKLLKKYTHDDVTRGLAVGATILFLVLSELYKLLKRKFWPSPIDRYTNDAKEIGIH